MKQRSITIEESNWIINIYAFSRVHQIIEIRDRHSNQKVCDDLVMHATVLFVKSYKRLELSELEVIRQTFTTELESYDEWSDVTTEIHDCIALY